jgi:hypothetical protein
MLTAHDTDELTAVRSSLVDVRTAVRSAETLLQDGQAVDLTGMDARIEWVCRQALDLPPPYARATLPDLMDLRDTVDALIETLASRPAR